MYERREMESVLKDEKLIKMVRLFPWLCEVNTKSDKIAMAKTNLHLEGDIQQGILSKRMVIKECNLQGYI